MVEAYNSAKSSYETYKTKYEAYRTQCTTCKGMNLEGEPLVLCGNECRTRAQCCAYHNLVTCEPGNPNKSEVQTVYDEELSEENPEAAIICYTYCCDQDT